MNVFGHRIDISLQDVIGENGGSIVVVYGIRVRTAENDDDQYYNGGDDGSVIQVQSLRNDLSSAHDGQSIQTQCLCYVGHFDRKNKVKTAGPTYTVSWSNNTVDIDTTAMSATSPTSSFTDSQWSEIKTLLRTHYSSPKIAPGYTYWLDNAGGLEVNEQTYALWKEPVLPSNTMDQRTKFAFEQMARMLRVMPQKQVQALVDKDLSRQRDLKEIRAGFDDDPDYKKAMIEAHLFNGRNAIFSWGGSLIPAGPVLAEAGWQLSPEWEVSKAVDDGEVVGQPARNVDGVWEPVDEKGDIISNDHAKRQRMSKSQLFWRAEPNYKTRNNEQVFVKLTKTGKPMFAIGDGVDFKRVSVQYINKGTHPKKRIYKRKPGTNPRAPAREHLYNTGVTKKNFGIGSKKFRAALTPYGRRKDRKAADQPYNTDGASFDPLTQDMPGVDDQMYNQHSRWTSLGKGMGQGWRKNTGFAKSGEASRARAAARRAAGFVPKARKASIVPGAGKGAFANYVKTHFDALSREVPPGYTRQEHARQVMKLAGQRYREEFAAGPAPQQVSAALAAAIVDDERSIIGAKRRMSSDDDDGDAGVRTSMNPAPMKRGRGRPKGSKNSNY